MKASIEAGELVVTTVDDSMLPSFDTEEDMADHVEAFNRWDKELHAQAKERYNKLSMVMLQHLSTAFGVLRYARDTGLKGRLEAEPENQTMYNAKRYCAMKLSILVKKTCNVYTYMSVDDEEFSILEALHNALLIRGDD